VRFVDVSESDGKSRSAADALFVRRVLIAVAIGGGVLVLWQVRAVLVLLFGAILIATIFRAIAAPLQKHLHLPERFAVALSVILIIALIADTAALIGTQVAAQGQALAEILPHAASIVDSRIASMGFGRPLEQLIGRVHSGGLIGSNLSHFVSSATMGFAGLLIVFFGGIFLAAQPRLYSTGFVKLVPAARRGTAADALEDSGRALRLWLKGQLWAMTIVFVLTWGGLELIGVPSALVLGLISGVLEFIPYAGAITSSAPAILVGLAKSPETALWVIGLYVIVHHVEAYIVQPVIQQFADEIPAVITLFCLFAFGVLFGLLGVLFAAPLTVVGYVLVKRLYVIEALDTATPIPGADKE
jgi:predicted PurR-regulated permease PerM